LLLQILEFKKGQLSQVEQHKYVNNLKISNSKWRSLKTVDQNLWLLSGSDIAQFHLSTTGLKLTHQWRIQLAL
jgi:hypothetical protein